MKGIILVGGSGNRLYRLQCVDNQFLENANMKIIHVVYILYQINEVTPCPSTTLKHC